MVLVECLDRSLHLLAVPAVLLVVLDVLLVAVDGHLVLAQIELHLWHDYSRKHIPDSSDSR